MMDPAAIRRIMQSKSRVLYVNVLHYCEMNTGSSNSHTSLSVRCVNVDVNTLPLTWYCPSCTDGEKKGAPTDADNNDATATTATSTSMATTATAATKPMSNLSKEGEKKKETAAPTSPIKNKGTSDTTNDAPKTKKTHQSPANENTNAAHQKQPSEQCTLPKSSNNNQQCLDHGGTQSAEKEKENRREVSAGEVASTKRNESTGTTVTATTDNDDGAKTSLKTTTFRTVTVPDGVVPGEVFHVLLGSGRVMGVVLPKGVRSGDKLAVVEPDKLYEPPIPAETIAKMNEQQFTNAKDPSESSIIFGSFWKVLWPALRGNGFTYERQLTHNFGSTTFYAPGGKAINKPKRVQNVHYFLTIPDIRAYMNRQNNVPSYAKFLLEFDAEVAKRKEMARSQQLQEEGETHKKKRRRANLETVPLDQWKYTGEREHISIGRQYQAQSLPRAGTHETGEEAHYM